MEEVLARLQSEAVGALSTEQQARAREVLEGFCGGMISETPRRVVSTADANASPSAGEGEPAIDAGEADETLKVLGVEFQRADEDSRGHERLKKKR